MVVWVGGLEGRADGSEAGSYLRLIDFGYHSTLGLRVIKKKRVGGGGARGVERSRVQG